MYAPIPAPARELISTLRPDVVIFVADSNLPPPLLEHWRLGILAATNIPHHTINLPGGESIKRTDTLELLWTGWQAQGVTRSSLVVALGGGTVTDVVGLAASTFKRGLSWCAVPTTLLGMVDAAIGGKTAINFGLVKNLIGTFHPPIAVFTDAQWFSSLQPIELWNGWMEMAKHALIHSQASWDAMRRDSPLTMDGNALRDLAIASGQIKSAIVQQDPQEKGLRKTLNFGHTVGHALEACTMAGPNDAQLPHGMAVGWGMLCALHWSENRWGCPGAAEARVVIRGWLTAAGWGAKPAITPSAVWEKMQHDKKNRSGEVLEVGLRAIGEACWDERITATAFTTAWTAIEDGASA